MLLRLTTIAAVFLVWVPVAQAWSWPVQGPVLQPFSYDEAHPYDSGQHRGVDIGATASGDPVVAPAGGTVSFAGFVPSSGLSLTIETVDGYSVTLTHLGTVGIAEGATVSEGDTVASVGPSGTPEQTVPYVHLGVRLTADSLGYIDPLGLLPAPEPPASTTTTTTTTSVTQPAPTSTYVPKHRRIPTGGIVIEQPAPAPPASVAPAEPQHVAAPHSNPRPEPKPAPVAETPRAAAPPVRRTIPEPIADSIPVVTKVVHAFEAEPFVLAVAPGLVAVLLALATAFTYDRRPVLRLAKVIPFRREVPVRRAA
jgi:hypothetical protein